MGKFCKNCGAQLVPNMKFCASCGAKTQTGDTQTAPGAANLPAAAARAPLNASGKTTTDKNKNAGASAHLGAVAQAASQGGARAAGQLLGAITPATAAAGESSFCHSLPSSGNLTAAIGPFKCLAQGFGGLIKGLGTAFREKKRWIPAVVLAVVWFVLTLLPLLGFNPAPVRWLSFLSFARGGTSGGLAGLIGGVLGKGMFAYFLTSLVMPMTQGQKPFAGVGSGLRRFFPALGAKGPEQVAPLLAGAGAALIGYNFMAGTASLQNSMVGLAALLLSLRALSGRAGFLRRFAGSLTAGLRKNKKVDAEAANRLLAGLAAGFALAVLLSATNIGGIGYIAGAVALAAGAVLSVIKKNQRGTVQ